VLHRRRHYFASAGKNYRKYQDRVIGGIKCGESRVSNVERALLDAAMRPALVGGAAVLAEAVVTAGGNVDAAELTRHARELGWGSALRRIGSIADALDVRGLAGQLKPLAQPTADLDPGPLTRERTLKLDIADDELVHAKHAPSDALTESGFIRTIRRTIRGSCR
jgi:predicted transcriptional regulator of viral defense system